ncbi:MAG: DMT family transporter [Thermoanaerobaculia bacterium]
MLANRPEATPARLSVLAAALLFSTGGAAIKGTLLSGFAVAGLRSAVAAIALLALLPGARRGFHWDLLPAAVAYAGTLVCFVTATKLTTSAAAIFLQSTAPVWVLLLAPLLLGERFLRSDLPYVVAVCVGLLLVFLGSHDAVATAPRPALGNLVALAAGLFYALLMVTLRKLARSGAAEDRSLPATVLGNVVAFAVCLPFLPPLPELTAAPPRDLAAIVYLGVVQIGVAYWLLTRGLRSLPALEVSLLVLLEPVLNPLWTWLLHGERPGALASAGGTLMLGALVVRSLRARSIPSGSPTAPAAH